jgi:hypothetical protein
MRVTKEWGEFELWIDWSRLRAILRCRLTGHAEPNEYGTCERCRHDLLHLPQAEKLAIAQRALNRHLAAHLEFTGKSYVIPPRL